MGASTNNGNNQNSNANLKGSSMRALKNIQFLEEVIETVGMLRAPGGCPWDRKQTHATLRKYLIEESYEVLSVIDEIEKRSGDFKNSENTTSLEDAQVEAEVLKDDNLKDHFCEELGDLLMQVLLHSEMANEKGLFSFTDVAKRLNTKLVSRHPHVFSDQKVENAEEALKSWEKQKALEKSSKTNRESILSGVPKAMPALLKAEKTIEKVTQVGFQWNNLEGPLAKVTEELIEWQNAVKDYQEKPSKEMLSKVESELGDLLFSITNVGFLMKLSAESSLRKMLERFESRFNYVERAVIKQGKDWKEFTLNELDIFWLEAKKLEK